MKVTREDTSQVEKVLHIELPTEVVVKEYDGAVAELVGGAEVAGFRKGHVPVDVIKKKFTDHLLGEIATRLIEKSISKALRQEGLIPMARPNFEVTSIREDGPFCYTAEVEVKPEINLKRYKDIGIEKRSVEVDDAEIEDSLNKLRESRAEFKGVDRPAEEGDMCMLDFDCFVDGEPVENGNAKDSPVVIGDTLLHGFDDVLIGSKAGDKRELDTTFPEKYQDKKLAGKDAHFDITVKGIRERVVPPFDNGFAKTFGISTMAELKEKFVEELKVNKANKEMERLKGDAIDLLVEENPFDVSKTVVDSYLEGVVRAAESLNKDREGYEVTPELKERYREVAKHHAKRDLILDWIAEKEDIEITNEEIEDGAMKMVGPEAESPDRAVAKLQREGSFEMLQHAIRSDKAYKIILGIETDAKG